MTSTMTPLGAARDLHKDQRGAIMLMGLCMSCFLIGGLWFLIGIGDTIVFRDTMQEAADHAAFTSAVLHAKGMNFISACNLILLAMITIHIVLGIIHDVLLAFCLAAALFSFGTSCAPYASFRNVYIGYGRIFMPIARVFHYLEQAAAVGYPFIAVAKGYTLGADYGDFGPKKRSLNVLVLSTSLVPGGALNGPINALFRQRGATSLPPGVQGPTQPATQGYSASKKSFLPVEPKPFSAVCERIGSSLVDVIDNLVGNWIPGPAKRLIAGIARRVLKVRYCNSLGSGSAGVAADIGRANDKITTENAQRERDNAAIPAGSSQQPRGAINPVRTSGSGCSIDPGFCAFWGEEGPFVPFGGTSNGSPWQQVWALNLLPDFKDAQQHRVHIGANAKHVEQNAKAWAYLAQAEFYFDCNKGWADPDCNDRDNAAYSIQWRARLRRLQLPQVGSLLASFGGEFLKNMTAYDNFKSSFGGGLAARFSTTVGGAIGVSVISGAIDSIFQGIEDAFGEKIVGPAGELLDSVLGGGVDLGSYH